MPIENHHERFVPMTPVQAGELLDGLSSKEDYLWPREAWPAMRLSAGLKVGSHGGHGPVRYSVQEYQPGKRVVFRFDPSIGLVGTHTFLVTPSAGGVRLSHHIVAEATGTMILAWPFAVRWLHDALVEDAFDRAAATVGAAQIARWSPWVRLLRGLLGASTAAPGAIARAPRSSAATPD